MLDRWSDWVAKALLAFAATLAFLLSFLVVADVVGRAVFSSPVKGTPEIVSMSIVIICFLQASYAIRSGGMLHVDVIPALLPPRLREALGALGCLLGVAFFGVVLYGGLEPLAHAWSANEYEGEGALRVPTWPARLAVLLGAGLEVIAAACTKGTPWRQHGGRGNTTRDCLQSPRGRSGIGQRAQQGSRVGVRGAFEDVAHRAALDDPACVHHLDALREVRHHAQVVGDK